MSDSIFDPNLFLDAQTTEVNEKRDLLPTENPASADGLYDAVVGEIKPAVGLISKGERVGQPWMQMIVPLKIQIPPQLQDKGLPAELTLTERPMIDLLPGSTLENGVIKGGVDNSKGKNNAQRIWRIATKMNEPGVPFSWRAMQGRIVRVRVKHEVYNDSIVEKIGGVFPVQ